MADAKFAPAATLFDAWQDELFSGTRPVMYPVGAGDLATVQFGPGRVLLVGGAPNAGKTVFAMQAVFDALRLTPTLKALVCNVEMAPTALLDRQLSRLARVSASAIRTREFSPDQRERVERATTDLRALCERVAFVQPPFSLENAARSADAFGANVLVIDYIQRVRPPGNNTEKKAQLDASMNLIRQFADTGLAVLVVAAVGRSKDSRGRNSYSQLNLASFRESSELEYGADDAYLLVPGDTPTVVTLRHVKSRDGATEDVPLQFDREHLQLVPFGATQRPATPSPVKPVRELKGRGTTPG